MDVIHINIEHLLYISDPVLEVEYSHVLYTDNVQLSVSIPTDPWWLWLYLLTVSLFRSEQNRVPALLLLTCWLEEIDDEHMQKQIYGR